ncbi:MAG: hypothetical protein HY755_04420 [Nitrospirae bacterium]|nr:hypothetical protein [Nitrospirota bacterium]
MKNQIKYLQNLFYDLLKDYGRVFIIVKYSAHTIIGKRGFTDEEKEKGLVLVFSSSNHRAVQWTEDGSIVTTLGFGAGNRTENCFVHCDDIAAVYSPDAKVKTERWDMLELADSSFESKKTGRRKKGDSPDKNVISLDEFRRIKI